MDTVLDLHLVRAVPERVLLRDDDTEGDGDALSTMTGHFSAFDTWYEIDSWFEGRFLERVARGAYKKTIRENRDAMKVLYDHGMDFQIGNKVLGPIDVLREDDVGAYYEVPLLDTSYNRDLLPGLRAGVYGASMRFRVIREEWHDEPGVSEHNPDGLPERTIKETRVYEFGPVTFPANPGGTAAARSLTDDFHGRTLVRVGRHADTAVLARAVAVRQADGQDRPSITIGSLLPAPSPTGHPGAAEDTTRTADAPPTTDGGHSSPDAPLSPEHPSATPSTTPPPQGDAVDAAIRDGETAEQVERRAARLRVAEHIRTRRQQALRVAERYDHDSSHAASGASGS